MRHLVLFLFLLPPFFVQGQNEPFTKNDSLFFAQQLPKLHAWFEKAELDDVIDMRRSRVQPYFSPEEGRFALLHLHVKSDAKWCGAVVGFAESNAGSDLREIIFRKFYLAAQVELHEARVYLTGKPDENSPETYLEVFALGEDPETGNRQFEYQRLVTARTLMHKITLPTNLAQKPKLYFGDYHHFKTMRARVTKIFQDYFRTKDNQSWFEDNVKVNVQHYGRLVKIEVTNIKGEVIPCETNRFFDNELCPFERFVFFVKVEDEDDQQTRYSLEVIGQYGGGIFMPRATNYESLEDDEHLENFKAYARRIKEILIRDLQ